MEPKGIKIFVSSNSSRIRYIARLLLEEILGLKWEIVTDRRKLGKSPVINYSDEDIKDAFRIEPDPLLYETGIKEREIVVTRWRGLPVFFLTSPKSDFPFDIFAASFYLVTRYEEYLGFEPDNHGRYRAENSLAFMNDFLRIPVVDLWTREFARVLIKKFPFIVVKRSENKSMITFDVDEAFEYKGNAFLKGIGNIVSNITRHGSKGITGKDEKSEKDPYDVFDYLKETIKKSGKKTTFFFPVGDHTRFDKNPGWKNHKYRKLIADINGEFDTGIHFSYNAGSKIGLLKEELSRFRTITGKSAKSSRLHFLRLRLPETYRNLIEAGITEDYSMGYAEEPGFRAGIARPFNFYDLVAEKETELRIVPFQIMDATLSEYKMLDISSASDVVKEIIDRTEQAGGLFVSIWHNTTLIDKPERREWRALFENIVKNPDS
ncbi:MAG: hypothetical protein HPY62_10695 [Bacteroidales bacterium]|nr:hypothetical protein [Bacteroidales bacterium]